VTSKRPETEPKTISLEEFGRDVDRRRKALGDGAMPRLNHADFAKGLAARRDEANVTDVPRNSGTRRTASKRALLKAIEDSGGKW
jgi:hypothetical protein